MTKNYSKLHEISKKAAILNSIQGLLEWDQETYMPQEAISIRSTQIEIMAQLLHRARTGKSFSKALGTLIDLESGAVRDLALSSPQKAALREWRRDYLHAAKLPASYVKTFAKTTSASIHQWSKAKEKNNFALFAPHLEKIVTLCRKKTELLGYKDHPYDALLDLYEPGMTTAYLTPLFSRLKEALISLMKKFQKEVRKDFLYDGFDPHQQLVFGEKILERMGFDPKTCRLDQSSHPFCMGLHPKDTRMTTKIHPTYFPTCLFAIMHEAGHGLYNKGLKEEYYGSPLGEPVSLGIDESQSRWWETRIGHSLPFWRHFYPLLQTHFPKQLSHISLDEYYRAINCVTPSLIRIEADEVTYSLHVVVRFELEKALIEGSLKVKELPEAWNEKMQAYLGVRPESDAEGCLQDIHWSMGGLGYFPTYTLGNLYASQFFLAFEKAHPKWEERVSQGELLFIREWLRENIHQYGREFTPEELVKRVTGSSLSEAPFVEYLKKKYGDFV